MNGGKNMNPFSVSLKPKDINLERLRQSEAYAKQLEAQLAEAKTKIRELEIKYSECDRILRNTSAVSEDRYARLAAVEHEIDALDPDIRLNAAKRIKSICVKGVPDEENDDE